MAKIAELVKELRQEREVLDKAIAALMPLAAKNGTGLSSNGARGPLSAAARRKIAAAQRARWARFHAATSAKSGSRRAPKPVRVMSAAARRKIAAAQRARWAKVRQQKAA